MTIHQSNHQWNHSYVHPFERQSIPLLIHLAIYKSIQLEFTKFMGQARGREVKIDGENTWSINRKVNCETYNCIYMIQCKKSRCEEKYIGHTKRIIEFRIADHRGYITNQVISRATGAHFNLPGHSLADLKFTILEQVRYNDEEYRREREKYFINKFDTFYHGINREI